MKTVRVVEYIDLEGENHTDEFEESADAVKFFMRIRRILLIYTENGASNMAVTNGKDSLNVQNITDMIGEQTLLTIV